MSLTDEVRVFVRKRSPGTSEEAAKLADDYFQARKDNLRVHGTRSNGTQERKDDRSRRQCHRCGKIGHIAKDCRVDLSKPFVQGQGKEDLPAKSGEKFKKDRKDIECFNCGKKGHIAMHCPSKHCFVEQESEELSLAQEEWKAEKFQTYCWIRAVLG